MSKSNVEKVKAFITTRKDTVRYAYKKFSNDVYRRFVLLGTTNNPQFLTDRTGNRRFLVVNVKKVQEPKKSIFSSTIQEECDQIMAEAYHDYLEGKNFLVMPQEFNEQILAMQNEHTVDDEKEGMINKYLEDRMLAMKEKHLDTWGVEEYYCCIKQLFIEALGYKKTEKITRSDINDVALILQNNPNWKKCDRNGKRINTAIENIYGTQKAYQYIYPEKKQEKKSLNGNEQLIPGLREKVIKNIKLENSDYNEAYTIDDLKQIGIEVNEKEE